LLLNLKALIVVLSLSMVMFAIARSTCLYFMSAEDFDRRRKVWIVLTIAGFLSPNLWLYVLVALPLMAWAAAKDSNPIALYLLLFFVIPPVEIAIPTIGINQLFDMNQVRLMAFAILIPAVWARVRDGERIQLTGVDGLMLAYGLLQLVLLIPYESFTNTGRRAFLYFLDAYLVYFAFSRLNARREALTDSLATICLIACVLAPIAVFESVRHWLLYTGINDQWGSPNTEYLMRGDSLRAQVSTGHSIPLGTVFAMGIGCWMCLKAYQDRKGAMSVVFALLTVGVFVTYARGPWLGAAFAPLVFLAIGSRNASSLAKGLIAFAAAAGLILMTPLGPSIIENLPFIGTANQGTVEYRQQLAETSWRLIKENPWFGNPFVILQMEELRQGGIIDIVNAFANVALFYGLTGLALFVGAFVVGLIHAYRRLLVARRSNDDNGMTLGASLIACVLATLLVMATAGFSWWQWPLLGLLSAYAAMQSRADTVASQPTARPVAWVNARPRSNPARSS
jgi:hypothetical protein